MSAPGGPGRRSTRRVVGRALAAGAVLLVLLLAAGLWLGSRRATRASHPPLEGTLAIAGAEARLEIVRDRRGVPHVRAASEEDAWFGLGFAHAQDRLGQMLWLRRVVRGRTAARLGPEGLAADRWMRALDPAGAAARDAAALGGRPERVLRAYAAGVNARLARIRAGEEAPPRAAHAESLEDWTPADSLALVKLHALGLEDTTDESLVLAAILQRLGPLDARPFFPADVGFDAIPRTDLAVVAPGALRAGPGARLRAGLGLAGADVGSTALLVSGAWTRRGGALLAADTHFAPRRPAPLYEAHLRGGALEVAGATLPGAPLFWVGFTPDVVWASTASRAVVMDLVAETLGADGTRYRDADGWRPLEVREERIEVAGGEAETFVVRRTRRGPLVDDLLPGAQRPLALKWPGALPGDGLAGFLALPHARDVPALRRALARHHEPVVAVVYAERSGRGGLQLAGFVPRRALPSGLVPVPGRNPAYDWSERLPFEALPRRRLDVDGPLVVAADGPIAPRASGIEFLWRSGERARRLEQMLRRAHEAGSLRLEELVALQRDVHSAGGELVDRALRLAGPPAGLDRESRQVAALLADWDRRADAESVGASAYAIFELRLLRALLEPVLGPELLARWTALPRVRPLPLLLDALRRAEEEEGPLAEAAREAVRRSLRDAWIHLTVEMGPNRAKWTWGRLHPLRFRPLVPGVRGAVLGPFAYGGDATSVRVGEYRPLDSFETTVVSGYRFVAAAGDLDQALTSLAPGQSEHPGHPHADDGLARWLEGRPSLLSTSDPVIEDAEVRRLVLVPAD